MIRNDPIASFATKHFMDRERVFKRIDRGKIVALKKAGAYTRTIARRQIRKPRMVLTTYMRRRFEKDRERWEKNPALERLKGKRQPILDHYKRPQKAIPGKPPFSRTGLLRNTIFFGYDADQGATIVGPIKLHTGTAGQLEHGGSATLPNSRGKPIRMQFKGNPFMAPALKMAAPKVGQFFKNIL